MEDKYPEDIQQKIDIAAQRYESPDIFKAGVDYAFACAKILARNETQPAIAPGLPPLPEPILTDEDVKQWEDMESEDFIQRGGIWQARALAAEKELRELKAQPSAVWVKASDFKTNAPVHRPYRRKREDDDCGKYDYGEIYVTEDFGRIFLDIDGERSYEPQSHEKWKDYEILDESGLAAAGREEAVVFAEWIREQNYKPYAGSWYMNGNNYANQPHSTRNLWDLFKQQNRNNVNS